MHRLEAYGVHLEFPQAPRGPFKTDRHYLLYASKGSMRLESEGKSWSLPPARAAIITANQEITITLPQKMTVCSALFHPSFVPQPAQTLSVFEMTPLARELILECSQWGQDETSLTPYARQLFQTLATITWELAKSPSPAVMPTGQSDIVKRSLELTSATLADDPRFEDIASQVATTPRSLARRYSDELGMTWRQALRKLRMIQAIEQLALDKAPVTEIAFSVGYNSLSAFNAAFLDFTGKTPTQYRDSFRQSA